MSPYARKYQLFDSLTYHIYNRSNSKKVIFYDEQDYEHFCNILKKYIAMFSLRIYHWVIMPTHYHLLLELVDPEKLSRAIAGISLAYTKYFHKRYKGCGYLWQGRFQSKPVQKENYMLSCGRYIDYNPVKDKIVTVASDYTYGSARFYCLGIDDGITTTDPMYEDLGTEKARRQEAYTHFLQKYNDVDNTRWEDMKTPQGDEMFIQRLTKGNGRIISLRRGRPKKKQKN